MISRNLNYRVCGLSFLALTGSPSRVRASVHGIAGDFSSVSLTQLPFPTSALGGPWSPGQGDPVCLLGASFCPECCGALQAARSSARPFI